MSRGFARALLATALLPVLTVLAWPQTPEGAAAARSGYIFLSLISGTYNQDQTLRVEPVGSMFTLRYSFRDVDGSEGPWIRFREPLVLSAAPGEDREYRLIVRAEGQAGELERRELQIRIDKRQPAPPAILPAAGMYGDPVKVQFQSAPGTTISYSVQGDVMQSPVAWDGSPIAVGRPEEKADYFVQAYAEDAAGNRSTVATARYSIDTMAPGLDVLSPVTGTFGNPQILALSFRNLSWVRYSDDGSDPATNGIPYTGPVMLRKQGATLIRVAAQPRSASQPVVRREISFTYAPEPGNGLLLDVDSGAYPQGVTAHVLSAPAGSVYYTLWEKTPSDSDFLATTGIDLPASDAVPRTATLRMRALSDAGAWGVEYRYFYFLGRFAATPPTFVLADPEPLRGPSRFQVSAPEDALVSATVDGSVPNPRAPTGTDFIAIPASASVTLRAVAFNGSGVIGTMAEKKVSVATDAAVKPVLSAADGPVRGTSVLTASAAPSAGLVFEMTSDGSDPPAPVSGSPRLSLPLVLRVPFGMQRTFKIRPASIDAFGRIVAPGDVTTVVLKQRPPGQPAISPLPSSIALDEPASLAFASPAKAFVTISNDGTDPRDPDPAKDTPSTSVPLPGAEGAVVSYRIKCLAVDDAGLASDVFGPFTYVVDLRTPQLPAVTGIADGGTYNARQIAPAVVDSPWTVHYTSSADGTVPPAPDAHSPLLAGASFRGEEGSITTFKVRLLAVSRNGKRTGEQKDLSFTIDLKPPDVPQLSGAPDGSIYARPVVLTPDAMPAGDTLYYSVGTGGADAPDPVAQGQKVSGSLKFDSPDGARTDYLIRVATQDEAGNRSLYDRRYHFSVDRSVPDDPEVSGAPDSGLTDRPVTLALAASSPTIVYELTDDGSTPRLPTPSSTAYASPILLAGKTGAAVTYRLLGRAFNTLGTPSRAARIVTVTVDRTTPDAPGVPRMVQSPGNPSVAYLVWDAPSYGQVYYRVLSATGKAADYVPYVGPVSVMIPPPGGSTIAGDAVVKSPSGAQSAPTAFTLSVETQLAPPTVRGARDGALVTQKTELNIAAPAGDVRYEIATDGSYPPAVTAASPLVPNPLVLDAADGQTVSVMVAARAFDPQGIALPSTELRFSLTIDKTPPDPPVAAGIEDGAYYQDSQKVTLLAPEGTIYYTVSNGTSVQLPSQTPADKYAGEFTLDPDLGRAVIYRIIAFTVDDAGNRSREIRSWTVTIDQQMVYVSPTGNDYAEGSRGQPVQSIGRALQLASVIVPQDDTRGGGSNTR